MGKSYSGQPLALGFNPQATKPLDTREVIDTEADRLNPNTWKDGNNYYVYPGMETRAKDTGEIFVYIGEANNPVDIANPKKWVSKNLNDYIKKEEYTPIHHVSYTEWQQMKNSQKTDGLWCILDDGTIPDIEESTGEWHFGESFPIKFG